MLPNKRLHNDTEIVPRSKVPRFQYRSNIMNFRSRILYRRTGWRMRTVKPSFLWKALRQHNGDGFSGAQMQKCISGAIFTKNRTLDHKSKPTTRRREAVKVRIWKHGSRNAPIDRRSDRLGSRLSILTVGIIDSRCFQRKMRKLLLSIIDCLRKVDLKISYILGSLF